MKSSEIRAAYLEFFEQRGHRLIPSSSLVPANDPTLLFTNSGMVQFKDALSGREDLGCKRATSAQRCVRAGGKHNDLENVGYTGRHHTFFEMMGNFSFGDYFKEEAIAWAWEFITKVLAIDPGRLWVTVHEEDHESERLWVEKIGFPKQRVTRLGDGPNFWSMGDTGPCGPNTEIFFDHGPSVPGGPPGTPDEDGDRFVEIWNLVFPQFDLQPDGFRAPLDQYGVDTGMGLERVTAVMQGVHSNYAIDSFRVLLAAAGEIAGIRDPAAQLNNASLRVIADHLRATAFLIADGVIPGNGTRNYVLRRIMRRALRHSHKLGIQEPFLYSLVAPLAEDMGDAYPILRQSAQRVASVVRDEEERFADTLARGMELLEREIKRLTSSVIPGDVVFRLYDTYGFPDDLTADIARERGLTVDREGYERAMDGQRERAREASGFVSSKTIRPDLEVPTRFVGYKQLSANATVTALYRLDAQGDAAQTERVEAGSKCVVVLNETPFYAESGGQVGDAGRLLGEGLNVVVHDTKPSGGQHLHFGQLIEGELAVGRQVNAQVDAERRRATALNHSATHLLHAALRQVLGAHVEQKGSLVDATRLRFDFSQQKALTRGEIAEVERIVNQQVLGNSEVETQLMGYDDAMNRGAMALFGEKYGERVRVLSMGGSFSVELCGGTHVTRSGDIGALHIVSESGIAAGVRRIEAITGEGVHGFIATLERMLDEVSSLTRTTRDEVPSRVKQLLDKNREMQRELEQLKAQLAGSQSNDLIEKAIDVGGIKVLAVQLQGADSAALLSTLDALKTKLNDAVIVLASVEEGVVSLIAGVSKSVTDRIKAGDVIRDIGQLVGARGGGRADMAKAGGGANAEALPAALASVPEWVAARIK